MKTVMFNPYTGTPRHPSDIASDPSGLLILEPGAPLRAAAQVVALEPEGPDGHGVNWLAGKRPKPGDLLYGGDAVARALAAKNEAESRELKAAQELDEAITMLHNFADLCAEFCDHTPDSFNRQVMRLGNAARLLLNARKPWSSDLGPNARLSGAGTASA